MLLPVVLLVVTVLKGLMSLKFSRLDVPGAILRGESVWLACIFDPEQDGLYSVKWYKNNEEFYRYLPRDSPPGQTFDLLGVHVELSMSNKTHVFLPRTELNTEGNIACEVSADAPSFKTFREEKELRVYVLPNREPLIEGVGIPYDPGDEVNLTCTSDVAKPAPLLNWAINGREVWDQSWVRNYPIIRHPDGLQSSRSQLNFVVQPEYIRNGILKVQCLATISQIYAKTSEEFVVGETTMPTPPSSGENGPSISGGRTWYDEGQDVDVNCTSPKSPNPVELQWFINDQEAKAQHVIPYPSRQHPGGLETAQLGLRFRVQKYHMRNTELRLKCTAAMSKVVRMSSEETVLGGTQRSSGLHGPNSSKTKDYPQLWSILLLWIAFQALQIHFGK